MRVTVTTSNTFGVKLSSAKKTAVTVGIQGPAGISTGFSLGDITDIDVSTLEDGFVLVYDAVQQKWIAQRVLNKQQIDAGEESY